MSTTTTPAETAQEVDRIIEENSDHWLERLSVLVNQPSISSQNLGMEETAHLVVELLEEIDFDAEVMPSEVHPVVYAESRDGSNTSLLCYNHYDVQPPEPLGLWDSPPFEATRRNGCVYGRGIQDDKGQLISRLAALAAIRDVYGRLPLQVKFMVEGGEEISSPGIPEFVHEHQDLLAADACVWETGGIGFDGRPGLVLGLRGICYLQLNVRCMSRDAHSGSAHLLPNAAWRLVRALETIKDLDERVLVGGFYEHVREPDEAQLQLLAQLPDTSEQVKRSYGIDAFLLGLEGLDARRAVFSPTANIAGVSSGYQGPGPKTVIPSEAMAKIDFRLVPDQDPIEIFDKVRDHLHRHGFEDVEVEYVGGERPGLTPPTDPFVKMTIETAEEVYGSSPTVTPLMGGSGPIAPFRDYLQVPVVTLGISHPESFVHAPNEHIRIDQFLLGTKHMARLAQRFASDGKG